MAERDRRKEILDIGKQIVVFIGPEGSGKTKQAQRLADESNKPYFSTGDIIRNLRDNDQGSLGDKMRTMFDNNAYLDPQTLLEIVADKIKEPNAANGFILDGGLRTLEETEDFTKMLDNVDRLMPLTVIYLKMPVWISYERLVSGTNARKRIDGNGSGDTKKGVTKKLASFLFQFRQRLDVINNEEKWNLLEIDATQDINSIYNELLDKLQN